MAEEEVDGDGDGNGDVAVGGGGAVAASPAMGGDWGVGGNWEEEEEKKQGCCCADVGPLLCHNGEVTEGEDLLDECRTCEVEALEGSQSKE